MVASIDVPNCKAAPDFEGCDGVVMRPQEAFLARSEVKFTCTANPAVHHSGRKNRAHVSVNPPESAHYLKLFS